MAQTSKLEKSVQLALENFMGLSNEEIFLVLTDEYLSDIGRVFFEVGKKITQEALYVEMKAREINGQEPPEQIADLMKNVDVVVCPTYRSLTHTDARREASSRGVRIGTMPGITLETIERCFGANPDKIVELTEMVFERMKRVSYVRVTSKAGTDFIMNIKGRRIIPSTGVLRKIGESGNLPSGEVYTAPWEKKSNGVIIFDGSFAGIGLLKNPIKVEVKNGYIQKIEGDKEAKQLEEILLKAGKDSNAVAEFGIGTNYKAKLCGQILEDEKVLGTIHIAFGNNITMGGKINVKSHLDGLVKKPTVYFDDVIVMKDGKLTKEMEA